MPGLTIVLNTKACLMLERHHGVSGLLISCVHIMYNLIVESRRQGNCSRGFCGRFAR